MEEARVIVEAIRQMGRGKAQDPLGDPDVLATAPRQTIKKKGVIPDLASRCNVVVQQKATSTCE